MLRTVNLLRGRVLLLRRLCDAVKPPGGIPRTPTPQQPQPGSAPLADVDRLTSGMARATMRKGFGRGAPNPSAASDTQQQSKTMSRPSSGFSRFGAGREGSGQAPTFDMSERLNLVTTGQATLRELVGDEPDPSDRRLLDDAAKYSLANIPDEQFKKAHDELFAPDGDEEQHEKDLREAFGAEWDDISEADLEKVMQDRDFQRFVDVELGSLLDDDNQLIDDSEAEEDMIDPFSDQDDDTDVLKPITKQKAQEAVWQMAECFPGDLLDDDDDEEDGKQKAADGDDAGAGAAVEEDENEDDEEDEVAVAEDGDDELVDADDAFDSEVATEEEEEDEEGSESSGSSDSYDSEDADEDVEEVEDEDEEEESSSSSSSSGSEDISSSEAESAEDNDEELEDPAVIHSDSDDGELDKDFSQPNSILSAHPDGFLYPTNADGLDPSPAVLNFIPPERLKSAARDRSIDTAKYAEGLTDSQAAFMQTTMVAAMRNPTLSSQRNEQLFKWAHNFLKDDSSELHKVTKWYVESGSASLDMEHSDDDDSDEETEAEEQQRRKKKSEAMRNKVLFKK